MRILVVGAGAIGGYYGGRLLQSGADVTFLVRPKRQQELARDGLVIKSPLGDAVLGQPKTVQAKDLRPGFDLVLLSCKAFDLDEAIKAFLPALDLRTAVLPLLNGMLHLEELDRRCGPERVLGGQCSIAVTLNPMREVVQLSPTQSLSFGERSGEISGRIERIAKIFTRADFGAQATGRILSEMWEKWVFLTTLAGSTSLMRAPIGDIVASPGGRGFIIGVLEEASSVASASGYAPSTAFRQRTAAMLTADGSPLTASMFRDIKMGARIEAEHIVGDLLARAEATGIHTPLLRVIYVHLEAYGRTRSV